jgi:hypothetical protein
MPTIDLDALVAADRLPTVKLYGRTLQVRPMTGAAAHRVAAAQTDDPSGAGLFPVLLEVVARSLPELTREELDGLTVEQVMALVQLTRGQVADVEAALAAQAQAQVQAAATA